MSKKIYIAYTGGTIGMKKTSSGYVPATGYLQKQMESIPELKTDIMPLYDIHEYERLLDSACMSPTNWFEIAKDIADNYEKYDGFIVLHGTDTMAYTASALPFILKGLTKPVILTGGQVPMCEVRNDSRENIITAMMIAADYAIPEVCLCFGSYLLRGNRSVKSDAGSFNPFSSPNYPPLASVGINIDVNQKAILPSSNKQLEFAMKKPNKAGVAALRLFPGISAETIENILQPPIKGMILETFGVGNGPDNDSKLLSVLEKASSQGIIIVNCTQCLKGRVDMAAYAAGSAFAEAGVISGYDMTTEAALAKMICLLADDRSVENVRKLMQKNLCGELTPDIVR